MSQSEPCEFVGPSSHWLVRAYHTPVRDVLRRRLSARLDVRALIAAAGLPAPLSGVIWQVVRRTRLWRYEKIDVARELVAHFADGLAAGRTAGQLAADFGDAKSAARLIRKAKIRNRPAWWQTCRVAWRLFLVTIVAAVLGYAALMARFYWGQPDVAHDYWADVNEARRVPEAERAWPLYRQAGEKLTGTPDIEGQWHQVAPGSDDWDKLVAYLNGQQEAIELVRAGAGKPQVGAVVHGGNEANPQLFTMNLDYAQLMRNLARLLVADARVAAFEGDGERVLLDLTAALAMADQLHPPHSTLVEQLIAIAVFNSTLDATGRILAEQPRVFSESQLRDLAHEIAACGVGDLPVDLSVELMSFDDMLQRIYTDDGAGDGRVTPEGLKVLDDYVSDTFLGLRDLRTAAKDDRTIAGAVAIITPGLAELIGGRRENREFYHSYFDEATRLRQGPPWQWDPHALDRADEHIQGALRGPLGRMRYLPVALLAPAVGAAYTAFERPTQIRDATQVAIALVLWHRRHDEWPENLEQLVPDLLPAVPPDRLDGRPLRYAMRDRRPVVYSIGMDHDDDGGRSVAVDEGGYVHISFEPLTPEYLKSYQGAEDDGDWILWPLSE